MLKIKVFPVAVCLIICGFWASPSCFSQQVHDHDDHGHDTSGLEIGLSVGFVHLKEEGEDAAGFHGHVMKRLGSEGVWNKLAIGLGAEYIAAEEQHYAAMVPIAVYPWRGLMLSVAPGVLWAEHEGSMETEYTTHLEAAYLFEVGKYDLGPVVGYSKTSEESHHMIGLHFGIHL
ncbi:hypothetical protein PDESU_04456 [Pontiella desulfatans]|uniref:Outer membrane protein beta-barrel domain-containing protein n=1 Tax=Pontiella desulfatans TaxID=2750659 RepID=A0A6C2U7L7_PONDE|nr:hypothetical protein [Pontiella desulfatans]VGO15869.1 hypothetical protein PDESU_04456 [Pontiella desulfatans]